MKLINKLAAVAALTFACLATAAHANDDAALARAAEAQSTAEITKNCMSGKDSQAQTACMLGAAMIELARSKGSALAMPAPAPAAAPAPVVVNAEPSTFGGWVGKALWSGVTGLFSTAERLAPVAAQVYTAKVGARSSERIAEFNNATLQTAFSTAGNVAQAGMQSNQAIAVAGFGALGNLTPSNAYTVSGNANFGPGAFTLTTSTSTNSGNTTRNCQGGAAGNSGGTAGGAGGAGGGASC